MKRSTTLSLILGVAVFTFPVNVLCQDSGEDYEETPYVRPSQFKGCDIGELDRFLPGNLRACAIQAMQGTMSIAHIQETTTMACKMLQKCTIFMKKGTPMVEDSTHRCLHGELGCDVSNHQIAEDFQSS